MLQVRSVWKKLTALGLSLLMAGSLIGCGSDAGTGAEAGGSAGSGLLAEASENDITVTLTTDREEYKAGEEISYSLTVANDRTGYSVNLVTIEAKNDEAIQEKGTPSISGPIASGESATYQGTLVGLSEETFTSAKAATVGLSGEVDDVTLRPYLYVKIDGQEYIIRYVVRVVMAQTKTEIAQEDKVSIKTVSCHDPAIVVGEDQEGKKCYYIFGSHRAWAKSYDLQNWTSFTNNLSSDYRNILAEPAAWAAHGSKNYTVDGYMWAPDVVYNPTMGKWCMYLSVDGDYWYSSIVLLTADNLEGDWTYEGIVVYSGFSSDEYYDETDVAEVTGEMEYPDRYAKGKQWGNYYPNNIDACAFYDDDGNLWMSYGSWSGGIYLLEMDENTGFRDKTVSYETGKHSDAYFGQLIAGGCYVSGEASYIQKIGDYYWLFMSYGGLEAKGGYNVRVFRSETPNGVYTDELGNTPYFDVYQMNFNMPVGVRLFGGYKWRTFTYGQVAQGHNSAFVDDDGRAYMVFHTRTTDGSEGHYVKVHQLFVNKQGWLVAAPYQTSGETLEERGYAASEVAGTYDVILHTLDVDYENLGTNKPEIVTLEEDGTISGGYQGTWSLEEGTPYIDLVIGGVTYSGVTVKMNVEGTSIETMTFTALGDTNQLTLWGSKAID